MGAPCACTAVGRTDVTGGSGKGRRLQTWRALIKGSAAVVHGRQHWVLQALCGCLCLTMSSKLKVNNMSYTGPLCNCGVSSMIDTADVPIAMHSLCVSIASLALLLSSMCPAAVYI